ncbi:MAG TPA: PilC/PilY family type IV pilus protein, partial [Nitrospiria bacterium]|nr:PilC/PilY family type IV pilus protein [Nitrospiria bacterium]
MKSSLFILKTICMIALLSGVGIISAHAQTLSDYSALPPFIGQAVTPNILLLLDNSASMNESAYHKNGEAYDPSTSYGGYFDNTKCYSYASSKFTAGVARASSSPYCSGGAPWDGNFLNYITMRKIEITKWVMMGGKCAPRVSGNCYPGGMLSAESGSTTNGWDFGIVATPDGNSPYTGDRCFERHTGTLYVTKAGTLTTCSTSSLTTDSFALTTNISSEPQGIIQQIGNKARFGLMEFQSNLSANGGKVVSGVGDNTTSMINAIENTNASTWTPLSESLYEAGRYFAQLKPYYANSDFSSNVLNKDPYWFTAPDWITPTSQYVPCCKSFVIIFTDGEPTQDTDVPPEIQGYAASFYPAPSFCSPPGGCTTDHTSASHNHATVSNHFDNCSIYYGYDGMDGTPKSDACNLNGSHYLDDVAYWEHTTDLRAPTVGGINEAGNDLSGMQNLTIYSFFAFGSGANILKDTAKMGGFVDLNGDGKPGPDPKEWDKNGDGVPDTYFESSNAFELRARLMAAITDILQKSASGTSVSVLATSSSGEGAIYQAYFYPMLFEGINQISWLGYLQGLFFDELGQLREDSNQDGRLVLSQDKIVETYFDPAANETKVRRYSVDSNGNKTGSPEIIGLREITPIFEAGKVLAKRDMTAKPRTIKTWVDTNNNGVVDSGEFIDFSTANESTLRPYLRAADSTEGTNIINFIRGSSVSGYRNRDITVDGSLKTWRLGDIIYSSPISVGAPQERFDLKYGDSSFTPYYGKYKERRHVVYVGANDGMLHAFNAGFFHQGDDPTTSGTVEHGWFSTDSKALGEEMWAFIPQELLPHLKWLTETDYDNTQHVYYVDGTPRITDAQIFTEEAACSSSLNDPGCIHPGGWGTILIGSMRFGGGVIKADLNGNGNTTDPGENRFRSAYFAMDITDPERAPTLLWVFN